MRFAKRVGFVVLAASSALVGCGSGGGQANAPSGGTATTAPPRQPEISVQLAWHHIGKFFGDDQVVYVARVTNRGGSLASVALDATVLDSTGTIIGSSQETLPNIPPHSDFDFFGYVGGGLGPELKGTPAKIEVSRAENAFGTAGSVLVPMLKTSEVTLSGGSGEKYTDMPYLYNLTAKVTNTTGEPLTLGVVQQTVLYGQAGQIVGGDTGSSDDVPQNLPVGASYREGWEGIPALSPATRAVYSVWPTTF